MEAETLALQLIIINAVIVMDMGKKIAAV